MPRIMHFGLGNFHRAHQAIYTQDTQNIGGTDAWSIVGVSLRSPKVRDQLKAQNFDYTLAIKDGDGVEFRHITVLQDCFVADQDRVSILELIADPTMQLITLTVTEKAYHLGRDGRLDLTDPAIVADLGGGTNTLYGLLTQGLKLRPETAPLTILSCDNLSDNGGTLARAFAQFAPHLADRIGGQLAFPSSMVDRITPATTKALSDEVAQHGGLPIAPVETERFSEWVIEDNFAGARPEWDLVGARLVADVAPFELRKLRMLNGAHSYLAYAGTLAGYDYVHEAIGDATLRANTLKLMQEAIDTLPEATKSNAPAYADQLIARFENPHLHHKLRQIAMDGSQKLPPRLLATWSARRDLGLDSPMIETACLAWLAFIKSESAANRTLDDPLAEALRTASPADALKLIAAPQELIKRLLA